MPKASNIYNKTNKTVRIDPKGVAQKMSNYSQIHIQTVFAVQKAFDSLRSLPNRVCGYCMKTESLDAEGIQHL